MSTPSLKTKLYIPPFRRELVSRPRLIERLSAGPRSGRKLTLISAPAGFGKPTLLSEWVGTGAVTAPLQVAWLSLDEGDNDPACFLTYFIAALQRILPDIGEAGSGKTAPIQDAGATATVTPTPERATVALGSFASYGTH